LSRPLLWFDEPYESPPLCWLPYDDESLSRPLEPYESPPLCLLPYDDESLSSRPLLPKLSSRPPDELPP